MGIRRMIYISDEGFWEDIQREAKSQNRSASNYLLNLHIEGRRARFPKKVHREEVKEVPKKERLKFRVIKPNLPEGFKKLKGKKPEDRARFQKQNPTLMCPRCKELNSGCICYE